MTREEAKSCIGTIEMLQRLAYNIHGVMDVVDADNCKNIIKALEKEPCDDCISRQAVNDGFKKYAGGSFAYGCMWDYINKLPSVTPKEKTGHWIKTPKAVMGEGYMWYCDKCQYEVYQDTSKNYPSERYCPNCGAKMEVSE